MQLRTSNVIHSQERGSNAGRCCCFMVCLEVGRQGSFKSRQSHCPNLLIEVCAGNVTVNGCHILQPYGVD